MHAQNAKAARVDSDGPLKPVQLGGENRSQHNESIAPAQEKNASRVASKRYSAAVIRQAELFAIRTNELSDRVAARQISFLDAVDMAYSAAEWAGLVESIGNDEIQIIMAAAFSVARKDPA